MSTEEKLEESKMEQNIAKNEEIGKEKESNNLKQNLDQNPEHEKEVTRDVELNVEMNQEKEDSKNEAVQEKDGSKGKEVMVETEEKKVDGESEGAGSSTNGLEKSSSFKEESNLPSDLKEYEKKALVTLRSKVEEAILTNKLFKEKEEKEKEVSLPKDEEKEKEKEKLVEKEVKEEEKSVTEEAEKKEEKEEVSEEGKKKEKEEVLQEVLQEEQLKPNEAANKNAKEEGEAKESVLVMEEEVLVDKDIAIWGVPLLSSQGDKRTDVILLKFLRARDFKVNDAFEMLRDSLQWRKQNNIDSILNESFEADFSSTAFMEGADREGHPVCYNLFGALGNDEMYSKALGSEEMREKFLRWRIQLMEKGVQKLDFNPGAASTMVQINDLKSTPLPTKKDVRTATRKAVELLQDNYPEFAAKVIFINVPFWYYAFSAVFSPFFTQRTKNKFIYSRSARVIDTLLKYISAEEIPVQYGGLKREKDADFLVTDTAKETFVKSGSTETIEIPATEAGSTLMWDLTVCGWEVNYKEEFVPSDVGSYTIIVQKGRKISWQESSIRNSYKNNEPGKLVITIENGTFKKKRILYRFKTKNQSSTSTSAS